MLETKEAHFANCDKECEITGNGGGVRFVTRRGPRRAGVGCEPSFAEAPTLAKATEGKANHKHETL